MPVKNVMLIDDDADDREFFLEVIDIINPSLVCATAINGLDALAQLTDSSTQPELIFLDLNMPLMNGWDFLAEIKNRNELRHIPIIVLTTSSDTQTKEQTKQLGARFFITKPDRISGWETVLKDFFHHFTSS